MAEERRQIPRRSLLKASGGALAVSAIPRHTFGSAGRPVANDRHNIAAVDIGGMGRNNLTACEAENTVALAHVEHARGQLMRNVSCIVLTVCTVAQTAAMEPRRTASALPAIYAYRASDLAQLRAGFVHPPPEAGPWVYWFWFSNVVSRREITRELEEMANGGIAGVELRCVTMRGFSGGSPGPWFDPEGWKRLGQKRLEYLSPEFVDILEHTLTEARRLKLRFSINLGMGWPPGGRWITEEHRSKHLLSTSKIVEGPARLEGKLALAVPSGASVAAWRLTADRMVDPASHTDLSGRVPATGRLTWNVPKGRWLVGVFQTRPGGLCDKGEGPEADPASREAMLFHLHEMFRRMEPTLRRFFGSTLVDVASDSWEYERPRKGRYWSPVLFREASSVLGYDLKARRYALLGYGPNTTDILRDIERLERETIHKNYVRTIADFVHARGLRHRPQLYGRGLERDLLTAYALADIPEIEEGVYVPEAVWSARILGKPIISAEAFTHISIRHGNLRLDAHRGPFSARVDPKHMWQTTPSLLRALSNAHFARGINRIQMHSFSYSPLGVPAPGWRMYAEIHLNRNVSWWSELKNYSRWVARNQFVLQSGVPVADALVYPVDSNPVDGPFNVRPDQPRSATNSVDAANPFVLARLADGIDERSYHLQRIVLRDAIQTLEEAQHLLRLTERGITIWCTHAMPDRWPALQMPENRAITKLRTAFARAEKQGEVIDAREQGWREVVKAGQSVRWPESARLSFQHRRVRGADVYFLTSWEEPFNEEVSFPHENRVPEIWDADTGQMHASQQFTVKEGRTAISIKLGKNESRIVVFCEHEG